MMPLAVLNCTTTMRFFLEARQEELKPWFSRHLVPLEQSSVLHHVDVRLVLHRKEEVEAS